MLVVVILSSHNKQVVMGIEREREKELLPSLFFPIGTDMLNNKEEQYVVQNIPIPTLLRVKGSQKLKLLKDSLKKLEFL